MIQNLKVGYSVWIEINKENYLSNSMHRYGKSPWHKSKQKILNSFDSNIIKYADDESPPLKYYFLTKLNKYVLVALQPF